MPSYVDGFVIPVPKKKVADYRRIAALGGKVWMKHGALAYFECVGDDLDAKFGIPFPKAFDTKKGETVVFSWIVYKSRAHRDRVNAKVMKDPAMQTMPQSMPFDCSRVVYGGFKAIVEK
ncbi:MAG: DUF1428 domain-containing protein [Opitutaceae bacterium]|nr:DUF1428 domain-containing protein [Opitutaceae bacterium]